MATARGNRWDDLRLGALVLAALAILAVGSLWIFSGGLGGSVRERYVVRLKDSAGLQSGAGVHVAGVRVGRVGRSTLEADAEYPVRFRIVLREPVTLHADATARVATEGFFGDPFLALDPGTPASGALAAGGEILGGRSTGMEARMAQLDAVGERAVGLLEQASSLLDTLNARMPETFDRVDALLSEENADSVEALLGSANQAIDETVPRLRSLLAQLDGVAESADRSLEGLPALIERFDALTADLQRAVGEDGERLAALLDGATATLSTADASLSVIDERRDEIGAILGDLEQTLDNMKAFSQTLEERPFSLIRIKPEADRRPGGKAR